MKITQLENQSLKQWDLLTLYSCARLHDTAGYYPLVEKSEQKIVMCLSRDILETLWTSLDPMFIYVQSGLFLVHKGRNIVISLNQDQPDISSNMFLLVQSSMHSTFINGRFGYAPGLLITRDESKARFPKDNQG